MYFHWLSISDSRGSESLLRFSLVIQESLTLFFGDGPVILAELQEVLVKRRSLHISWNKTKVASGVWRLSCWYISLSMCGGCVDIAILKNITYLGNVVKNNCWYRHEDLQQIGLTYGVIDSLTTNIWHRHYLWTTEIRIFYSLVLLVFMMPVRHEHCIATQRSKTMPFVISDYTESPDNARMPFC